MRNRWYEPKTGRFLSEDPIGLAGGINFYAFAGSDPIGGRDPTGLLECSKTVTTVTGGEADPESVTEWNFEGCLEAIMGYLNAITTIQYLYYYYYGAGGQGQSCSWPMSDPAVQASGERVFRAMQGSGVIQGEWLFPAAHSGGSSVDWAFRGSFVGAPLGAAIPATPVSADWARMTPVPPPPGVLVMVHSHWPPGTSRRVGNRTETVMPGLSADDQRLAAAYGVYNVAYQGGGTYLSASPSGATQSCTR